MTLEPLTHDDREQFVGRMANSAYAVSVAAQKDMAEAQLAAEATLRFNVFWKDLHTYFSRKHNVFLTMLLQAHYLEDILDVYGTPINGRNYPVMIIVYTKTFEAFKGWVQ